jgi:hypothetical protein
MLERTVPLLPTNMSCSIQSAGRPGTGGKSSSCAHTSSRRNRPTLQDNFYLNLVDWGQNDKIAVALKHAVYMYDVEKATVEGLDAITSFGSERLHAASVKWIGDVR